MNKILIVLLAIILIIQVPDSSLAGSDEPYTRTSSRAPFLTVTSSDTYIGKPGETMDIRVDIKNTSEYDAEKISGHLSGDPTGTVYIKKSAYDSEKKLNAGKNGQLSFKVKVDDLAEGGLYKLDLKITYYNQPYRDDEAERYTITESINVKVDHATTTPQIVVERVDVIPFDTVSAGDKLTVGFKLENIGTSGAKDIKVSLEGLSNDNFTLAEGVNYKVIPYLDSNKQAFIHFKLKSLKNLADKNYEVGLKISYKDMKNETIVDESKFFISTKSEKKSSNLIIENLLYPTGEIKQNKEVDITFDLINKGKTKAEKIIIEAKPTDLTGVVPKSVSIIKLDALDPNGKKTINFKFLTTNSAETKNYPIEITVEYVDELSPEGEKYSINQFVGIFTKAPEEDDGKKSVPKLIIDKYNFSPTMVKAGEKFEMNLSFYNTNSSQSVKNIKIFLTSESGSIENKEASGNSVFTPVDSSNTFYIDSIKPKGRVEKKITMFTVPDALAKTHTITANFEYEDSKAEPYTATELIGVPVVQQSKLELGELNLPTEAFVNEPLPVSLEFYNTGKVTLYNLMVKLEGNFNAENGQYYVGNFESGTSDYFDGSIIPMEAGKLGGELVFTYEDSTGETQEIRKEFNLDVMDMPPMDEFPDEFDPNNNGGKKGILKSKWLWIFISIIGAGSGVFFFKKKKKKKQEEMSLDE